MIVVVQVTVVVAPCEVHGSVWTADDVGARLLGTKDLLDFLPDNKVHSCAGPDKGEGGLRP